MPFRGRKGNHFGNRKRKHQADEASDRFQKKQKRHLKQYGEMHPAEEALVPLFFISQFTQ